MIRRGDIYLVDLAPTHGHEIRNRRPVLVVSPTAFNRRNPPLVAPVTRGGEAARLALMTMPLSGAGTQTDGVVLCNQIRTLDIEARNGKLVEATPEWFMRQVIARIADIFEFDPGGKDP